MKYLVERAEKNFEAGRKINGLGFCETLVPHCNYYSIVQLLYHIYLGNSPGNSYSTLIGFVKKKKIKGGTHGGLLAFFRNACSKEIIENLSKDDPIDIDSFIVELQKIRNEMDYQNKPFDETKILRSHQIVEKLFPIIRPICDERRFNNFR